MRFVKSAVQYKIQMTGNVPIFAPTTDYVIDSAFLNIEIENVDDDAYGENIFHTGLIRLSLDKEVFAKHKSV